MVSRSHLSGCLFDLVVGTLKLTWFGKRTLGLSAAKKAITDEVGLVHASRRSAHHAASRPHARTGQLKLPSGLENQGIYLDLLFAGVFFLAFIFPYCSEGAPLTLPANFSCSVIGPAGIHVGLRLRRSGWGFFLHV